MRIREIEAKSILSNSAIPRMDYCLNPYVGCSHGCYYCYADFMRRYTGHLESKWGDFVDVKVNSAELLEKEIKRKKRGLVILSSVTDPYQPLELKYKLTRRCLEVFLKENWPVNILTKSRLVIRDIDVIRQFKAIEVGVTVTTDSEDVRKKFERDAPSIESRINALRKLKDLGIKTYVFVGPILPMGNAKRLAEILSKVSDYIVLDCMNYVNKSEWVYRQHNFLYALRRNILMLFLLVYLAFPSKKGNLRENIGFSLCLGVFVVRNCDGGGIGIRARLRTVCRKA